MHCDEHDCALNVKRILGMYHTSSFGQRRCTFNDLKVMLPHLKH